jgi:hemerythrin-like domain-containing protein
MSVDRTRRDLLRASALLGLGALAAPTALATRPAAVARPRIGGPPEKEEEEEVTPAEDLMREHGVLRRILIVYGEAVRRLDAGEDVPLDAVHEAATGARAFAEDYHAKMEEQYVFPRFRDAQVLVGLVDTLQTQHRFARGVTDQILSLCGGGTCAGDDRARLAQALRTYVGMQSPHLAREDTEVFPKLRGLVGPEGYDAMGEQFERIERERFGEDGFEAMVAKVATIEKAFGLDDLSKLATVPV